MKKVSKLDLELVYSQTVAVPVGAKVLCVQTQDGLPKLWIYCDKSARKELREFLIHGTGHDIDDEGNALTYIGTFQLSGGALVFHVFEVAK